MISLQDYNLASQGGHKGAYPGQANMSEAQIQDVVKALEATHLSGQGALDNNSASGAPLKVESLDRTLKHITFKESNIVVWKSIPKMAAYNTVEDYNQLTSYGQDAGGFNREGELPSEEDSTYVRRAQLVKYMGVTKAVTHPMTMVTPAHGPVIQREIMNGSLWLLRKLNKSLTTGDASIISEEFNGMYTQHKDNDAFLTFQQYLNSEVVIDLRGAKLSEGIIEQGAEAIVENFGVGTELFLPPKALSNFVTNFYSFKHIIPNTASLNNAQVGQRVNSFASQFGEVKLTWDIFLNKDSSKTSTSAATSNRAPAPPVATSVTSVAATVANSKWGAGDAGSYYYAVAAINRFGLSQLTVLNTGALNAIVANGAVDLAFSAGAGANPTSGYVIYRSNPSATSVANATFYPLFRISEAQRAAGYEGAAAGSVRDLNNFLPNTDQAFLIQNNDEVWAFRQLAPLMKMDLAIVSPAYRFMILLYGTPILFAPKKMVRFINIGEG